MTTINELKLPVAQRQVALLKDGRELTAKNTLLQEGFQTETTVVVELKSE